ncbi:MAG: protoporphyrinogen oxidase [Planctomycetota bacterium]
MPKPRQVAIIGAGLSGLSLAAWLQLDHSTEVEATVFEASDKVGGVIQTEIIETEGVGRFVVDHGADMFATQPAGALHLCQRMGVEHRLQRPRPDGRGAMVARGDRLVPIPDGFVLMRPTKLLSMVTTPLLSPSAKWRILRERWVQPRDSALQDESVGSFVRRRLGAEVLDRLVAPLVAGIYTADVERLSMAATMQPLWKMESEAGSLAAATLQRKRTGEDSTERNSSGARYEQFRAFPDGMRGLFDAMREQLPADRLRMQTRVDRIESVEQGFRLLLDNAPCEKTWDDVVIATPLAACAGLLRTLGLVDLSAAADQMQTIPRASTAIVVMAVREDHIARLPNTFGFVVPPREQRAVLAGSFASAKFAGRAPTGYVILRAFLGGVLQPEILDRGDGELIEIVRREMGDLIGMDQGKSLARLSPWQRVVRWNDAMPQYEVGHLAKAAEIQRAIDNVPGLHVHGNALHGVGIAPLVERSRRLATAMASK